MTLADSFAHAQRRAKSMVKRPSNQDLLDLYSLFKQGSVGDVTGKRPRLLDVKGRAMYDAWSRHRGMPMKEAQREYVALVDRLRG